jgi:hypothetical protein
VSGSPSRPAAVQRQASQTGLEKLKRGVLTHVGSSGNLAKVLTGQVGKTLFDVVSQVKEKEKRPHFLKVFDADLNYVEPTRSDPATKAAERVKAYRSVPGQRMGLATGGKEIKGAFLPLTPRFAEDHEAERRRYDVAEYDTEKYFAMSRLAASSPRRYISRAPRFATTETYRTNQFHCIIAQPASDVTGPGCYNVDRTPVLGGPGSKPGVSLPPLPAFAEPTRTPAWLEARKKELQEQERAVGPGSYEPESHSPRPARTINMNTNEPRFGSPRTGFGWRSGPFAIPIGHHGPSFTEPPKEPVHVPILRKMPHRWQGGECQQCKGL